MTFPLWMLLGFALWTIVLLISTIGTYRWSRILTGRAKITEFNAAAPEGHEWYLRAVRAHANCLENLPVFAAIVFCIYASGMSSPALNFMSATVLVARMIHSTLHVALVPTVFNGYVRFGFFFLQIACFFGMSALIVAHEL